MTAQKGKILLLVARILALGWAAFWLLFGVASGLGEGLRIGGILMHIVLPGGVFLGIALLAWRWPNHGVFVLEAVGVFVLVGYPVVMRHFPSSTIIFVELTMALPPIAAGIMLLLAHRYLRGESTIPHT